MITLVLVDDVAATRQGLRMLLELEPDLKVVGEACDGAEALTVIGAVKPDVVVMDTEMPRMDGITATRRLQERGAETVVLVHTIHDDPVTRTKAAEAGAAAFIGKHEGYPALLQSIRAICPQ